MKTLKELKALKEKALTSRVFYYYESFNNSWAVEYSFEMPKRFYMCADYLEDIRYYKDEKTAVIQAKKLANNLGATYTGRAWDMEID